MDLDTPNHSHQLVVEQGIVLGIDYGVKKIGFAVGDTLTYTVHPQGVSVVHSFHHSVAVIQDKIAYWQPVRVVLGWPLDQAGDHQAMVKKVQQLATVLQSSIACPISFSDERYTTKVAEKMAGEHGYKVKQVDDWAAAILLQSWLLSQQKS